MGESWMRKTHCWKLLGQVGLSYLASLAKAHLRQAVRTPISELNRIGGTDGMDGEGLFAEKELE